MKPFSLSGAFAICLFMYFTVLLAQASADSVKEITIEDGYLYIKEAHTPNHAVRNVVGIPLSELQAALPQINQNATDIATLDGLRLQQRNHHLMLKDRVIALENAPAGADGRDGIDGVDGRDGIDGADGRDGVDGRDGSRGRDGVDGRDGRDGVDGRDGLTPSLTGVYKLQAQGIAAGSLAFADSGTSAALGFTAMPDELGDPVPVAGFQHVQGNFRTRATFGDDFATVSMGFRW